MVVCFIFLGFGFLYTNTLWVPVIHSRYYLLYFRMLGWAHAIIDSGHKRPVFARLLLKMHSPTAAGLHQIIQLVMQMLHLPEALPGNMSKMPSGVSIEHLSALLPYLQQNILPRKKIGENNLDTVATRSASLLSSR